MMTKTRLEAILILSVATAVLLAVAPYVGNGSEMTPAHSGYACSPHGSMVYSTIEGTLACIDGKWEHSSDCRKEGQMISAREVRLVCRAGKWTPPL